MRTPSSPYRYDRAAIRLLLEREGLEAARANWPRHIVDPIARALGLVTRYKNHDTWNPAWTPLLGTKPDLVLAGELGVPYVTIGVTRRKLGIPTFNRRGLMLSRLAALDAITDVELRTSTHGALASKYGVTSADISALRRRRGLPRRDRRGVRLGIQMADLRRVGILAIRAAFPQATLAEIAEAVGCTRERVRQVIFYNDHGQAVSA